MYTLKNKKYLLSQPNFYLKNTEEQTNSKISLGKKGERLEQKYMK